MTAHMILKPISLDGITFDRILIKTHVISFGDDIVKTVEKYTKDIRQKKDFIFISERVVAIMQGRSFPIDEIHPGFWAKRLYPFVSKHPGGIGLRSPWTMQLAIQETGLPRILLAAFASIITKPFGLKGIFYHVAGNNVNAIDGPCDYTLPPGNTSAKLGPKNPQKVAREIENALGNGVVVIDANDYGVNVLGISDKAESADLPIRQLFADNPMGQTNEQTPIAIIRKK